VLRGECPLSLSPEALLCALQDIESRLGRPPRVDAQGRAVARNGPRCIDLDLLVYGEVEISSATLTIPHPRMRDRAFVLVPLRDVAPDYVFPDGVSLKKAIENISYRLHNGRIWQ